MLFPSPSWLRAAAAWPLLVLSACSGTDIGYPRISDRAACTDEGSGVPVAGSNAATDHGLGGGQAATGGAATSGAAPGVGGRVSAGEAGAAGSSASGGAAVTAPFSWPTAYQPGATPLDGHHNPGSGCMSSTCHGAKVPFLFGGTVYAADGKTGMPNVEVGLSDGTVTLSAYSASNGNIWLPASAGAIDLSAAQIAIRDANGERVKPATAGRGAACNGGGCHGATMRLLAP